MEYNIVEDMKKIRANITFYELSKLKHQHKLLIKELKVAPTSPLLALVISYAAQEMGRHPTTSLDKISSTDIYLLGGRSNTIHLHLF